MELKNQIKGLGMVLLGILLVLFYMARPMYLGDLSPYVNAAAAAGSLLCGGSGMLFLFRK